MFVQGIPPIERDIRKEKNRIPRDTKKMTSAQVSDIALPIHLCTAIDAGSTRLTICLTICLWDGRPILFGVVVARFCVFPPQEDVEKWEGKEKLVEGELDKVTREADSLTNKRSGLTTEKRKLERSIREVTTKVSGVLSQLREKVKEKKLLETTRDNFIAM